MPFISAIKRRILTAYGVLSIGYTRVPRRTGLQPIYWQNGPEFLSGDQAERD